LLLRLVAVVRSTGATIWGFKDFLVFIVVLHCTCFCVVLVLSGKTTSSVDEEDCVDGDRFDVGIVRSPLFCGEENFFVSAIAYALNKGFGMRSHSLSLEIFSTAIARVELNIFH
jgi:hypothetical protein